MRPVQGVFRHISHEDIRPIIKEGTTTTSTTSMTTATALSLEPDKLNDFDVLFQASSSSVASKSAVLAMANAFLAMTTII